MIIYYESTARKAQCELCGKYFKTKGILRRHVESVHGSSKHPCDMCIYQAPNKDSLNQHKNALHKKVKFPCYLCNHQATTQDSYSISRFMEKSNILAINVTINLQQKEV